MNNLLPGFDAIPVVEPDTTPKSKLKGQYYIHREWEGEWYFLWKTHTNGGCDWQPETDLTINGGRKKPLLYKTISGAQRMLAEYVDYRIRSGVGVWHG